MKDYVAPARIRDPRLIEKRRAAIIEAAIDLFYRQGFHETTVEQIAETAGITVGALYKYVRSKYEILFLSSAHITETIGRDFTTYLDGPGEPQDKLRGAIKSYMSTIDHYARSIRLAYRLNASLDREAQDYLYQMFYTLRDGFVDSLRPVAAKFGETDETVLRLIGENLVMLGQMWAVNHRAYAEHLTFDDFVEAQTALVFRQLVPGHQE